MKLSASTLKKLIKGALAYEYKNGYLTPFRYSQAQLDYMADPSYDYGWRARARFAGPIRIEFITDSSYVSFDYRASDMHERSNTIDLYVNGTLTSVYKIEDRLRASVRFELPDGEKRVTIYLPCESKLDIKNFTIDKKYKSIKDKGEKILIIGDSITQGAGTEISSAAYANVISRELGYNIIAQGIGGYRFEAKDLMLVDNFTPSRIVVFLGTNYYEKDCEKNGYFYDKAVEEFYDKLTELYPTTKIIAITPLWRNNGIDWERFYWCIDKIKSACKKHPQIKVLDGFSLVPNVDECFSDRVHPNSYGSLLLAEGIMRELKKK